MSMRYNSWPFPMVDERAAQFNGERAALREAKKITKIAKRPSKRQRAVKKAPPCAIYVGTAAEMRLQATVATMPSATPEGVIDSSTNWGAELLNAA